MLSHHRPRSGGAFSSPTRGTPQSPYSATGPSRLDGPIPHPRLPPAPSAGPWRGYCLPTVSLAVIPKEKALAVSI